MIRRSRHFNRDWADQLAAVRRWYKRLDSIPDEMKHDSKDAALDVMMAFFLNCFHLKDWVKKSGHPKHADVESFIHRNGALELCRELCNAAKHFELDSPSGMTTQTYHEVVASAVGEPPRRHPKLPYGERWVVIADGGHVWDMFDLADRCMDLWEEYLR